MCWFWPPKVPTKPHLTLGSRFLGSPWPAPSQPLSQSAPATTIQRSNQPTFCHPVCKKLTPELLQSSRITPQTSKTYKNRWFSMVFAMSAKSAAASILNAQVIQIDTKAPPKLIKELRSSPKVGPLSTKGDPQYVNLEPWRPI